MRFSGSPATRSFAGRWFIVALTLIGLLGQLALQGLASPGETPRTAILRLTGIDISPRAVVSGHLPGHEMSGMHMGHGSSADGHHVMPMPDHHGHSGEEHHHDSDCPLCPLLLFFGILLNATVFLPAVSAVWLSMRRFFAQPRAPPAFTLLLPPATGPPLAI
ncbi:DUF2946 family protein [Acetobacter aceti]|uniref:DUF2946 domain-containing protein n=1 Tax=Acetobacter aceti TaxID=435 RepID=A0A6S6PRF1_ACEAC|nr:DUF2946 family protein [Acetobacter aceti]BCI67262.1 hypothetical protein AAJCM20276_18860 [Acetobacter aceti]